MDRKLIANRWLKYWLCYGVIAFGAGGYILTNHISYPHTSQLPLTLIDQQVPFWPWTIIVYSLIFGLVVIMPFLINEEFMLRRALLGATVLISLNLMVFVLFPVEYPARPDMDTIMMAGSFWADVYSLIHRLDTTSNCFPSMHVSMSTLFVLVFYRTRPKLFRLFAGLAVIISFSTLTTKQHYVIDVAAGLILGGLSYYIACRQYPHRLTSS
ncbi:TPA: hypothetical protein DF272_03055 [Candidatus Falkowbacteria bacterium]|nr:hypothetical protein [Candidatus Falkowbacteria bacterium]